MPTRLEVWMAWHLTLLHRVGHAKRVFPYCYWGSRDWSNLIVGYVNTTDLNWGTFRKCQRLITVSDRRNLYSICGKYKKGTFSLILFVVDFIVGLTLPGWAHLPLSIMNANSTLHIQNCKCTNGIYLKMHKVKDLFKITNNIFRKRHIHPKANFHKKRNFVFVNSKSHV